MSEQAFLGKAFVAPASLERSRDEVRAISAQMLAKIEDELSRNRSVRPETVNNALRIAFEAEDLGLVSDRDRLVSRLRVKDFLEDLDARERARQRGNLFLAYLGGSQNMLLHNHIAGQGMQRYLANLIFRGIDKEDAHKKLRRKIHYVIPQLFFKQELKSELLREGISVIQRHPFLNPNITFGNEAMRMAALHWKEHLLRNDKRRENQVTKVLRNAKGDIIAIASSALQGYTVDEYAIKKVRLRLWKGGPFKAGLRVLPGSNILMALFNGFCTGLQEFLMITNTPGKLATAEKLRKKGRDDESNYLRAAAIYLRHGETGKAVGLHSEVYAQRPVFTSYGEIVDRSSVPDTIGQMIATFKKWENRVLANQDQ